MSAKPSKIEVTLASTLKNVEVAEEVGHRVCVTAGFDEEPLQRIEMALHESLVNAVWHGNKNDATKQLRACFWIFDDRLEITVCDQGEGFDLNEVADPLAPENLLKTSGRGLFLIRAFMDEVRVEKGADWGAVITMVKRLSSRPHPNQGGNNRDHEGHCTPS